MILEIDLRANLIETQCTLISSQCVVRRSSDSSSDGFSSRSWSPQWKISFQVVDSSGEEITTTMKTRWSCALESRCISALENDPRSTCFYDQRNPKNNAYWVKSGATMYVYPALVALGKK